MRAPARDDACSWHQDRDIAAYFLRRIDAWRAAFGKYVNPCLIYILNGRAKPENYKGATIGDSWGPAIWT
jgi:hypothetical protein